jgi:Bcr/CflA subfamily drug resistance transporter
MSRILYIVALTALLVPMTNTVYNPNIPVIQKDLNATTQMITLTISAFTGTMALAQLFYGPLSDRRGRRGVMVFGLLVYVISSVLIFFSRDVYQLIALRALQAFGVSSGIVVGAAVLSDIYKKNLGNVMGTYQFVILIGPVIGPVIGGIIASFFGWRSIFLFLSLVGMAAFTLVYFLLDETLQKAHYFSHPLAAFKVLTDKPLFFVSFLGFTSLATVYVFITFFPIILNSYGIGVAMIGLAFLPSGLGLLGGSKIGGRVTDKIGAKRVIVMGTALSIATTGVFALVAHYNLNVFYALAAFSAFGIGSGMFWTASRVYVVNRSHLKASANGVFNFMAFLGATISPLVGSVIFEAFGALALFLSFALLMLVALLPVTWKA